MKRRRVRSQRRIRGEHRDSLPSCVQHAIRREVEATARHFGVSRSWVVAFVLAERFGIEIESYIDGKK